MSAHADWCRAHGIAREPAPSRRALARTELEGLEAAIERREKNARHAPTERDRQRALARADALLHRIVELNDELYVEPGGPECDSCGEPFRDQETAWELEYRCHRCRTERRV